MFLLTYCQCENIFNNLSKHSLQAELNILSILRLDCSRKSAVSDGKIPVFMAEFI
ncbi:MAG: hypothetical protein OFPII_03720 [Osedax symbiont Rs1]|nr:MAG: hypothetical protein OFPII_03720 [Osedax symbiont Rs1]